MNWEYRWHYCNEKLALWESPLWWLDSLEPSPSTCMQSCIGSFPSFGPCSNVSKHVFVFCNRERITISRVELEWKHVKHKFLGSWMVAIARATHIHALHMAKIQYIWRGKTTLPKHIKTQQVQVLTDPQSKTYVNGNQTTRSGYNRPP